MINDLYVHFARSSLGALVSYAFKTGQDSMRQQSSTVTTTTSADLTVSASKLRGKQPLNAQPPARTATTTT
eukprot:9014279-Pyramimonas_sp.AAC.1